MNDHLIIPATTFLGVQVAGIDVHLKPESWEPRVDLVGIIAWQGGMHVQHVRGVPKASPVAPSTPQQYHGQTWLVVAQVFVRPEAVVIEESDITQLSAAGYQR